MSNLQQTITESCNPLENAPEAVPRKAKSLRKSINEYCFECVYDPKSGLGTKREQVELCTVTKCPLYEVRPTPRRRVREEGLDLEDEADDE